MFVLVLVVDLADRLFFEDEDDSEKDLLRTATIRAVD
jgi:hypothetical protein